MLGGGVCTPENLGLGLGPVETPPGPPAPLPTETSEGSQSGGLCSSTRLGPAWVAPGCFPRWVCVGTLRFLGSSRVESPLGGTQGFLPGGLMNSIRAVTMVSSEWSWPPAPNPMAGTGWHRLQSCEGHSPHPHPPPTTQKGGTQLWPVVGGSTRPRRQHPDLSW